MSHEVVGNKFLILSREKRRAIIESFEGDRGDDDFGRLFLDDFAQVFSSGVLRGDDLIVKFVFREGGAVNDDEFISLHHEEDMQFEVLTELFEQN
jgi:hypothetical protein